MEQENQAANKRESRSKRREEKLQARAALKRQQKNKRMMTWVITLVVIIAIGYGIVTLTGSDGQGNDGSLVLTTEINERDIVKGNRDASVILVEYSDFQCPACRGYYPIVAALTEEFGESIAFVYRHFPLVTIHAYADLAARAAEAAGKQGKFFEMHDELFDNQSSWSTSQPRETIVGYAEELGLDVVQFEIDLESDEVKDKVRADRASGQRARVNSTPTFFLNGEKITDNPRSYEEFAELIRIQLGPEAKSIDEEVGLDTVKVTPNNQAETMSDTSESADHSGGSMMMEAQ